MRLDKVTDPHKIVHFIHRPEKSILQLSLKSLGANFKVLASSMMEDCAVVVIAPLQACPLSFLPIAHL